ncbi:MAG: hypothetical protein WC076_09875 [Terrimicrobiaceae bacterium]|jgi:hypothetical protein|nr:hypothetical protein [Terrimicrobiaceae bacterium]
MKKASKRGKNKAAPGFRATLLFWYQEDGNHSTNDANKFATGVTTMLISPHGSTLRAAATVSLVSNALHLS